MPLLQISKMKRGKGLKTTVKDFLKSSMLRDKRNLLKIKDLNENYEYDLIAILRSKPYLKRQADWTFGYEIEGNYEEKPQFFPPLSVLLAKIPEIIDLNEELANAPLKKIEVKLA